MKYDFITIGSATRDMFLFLDPHDAPIIKNPVNDPKREKLIALEFGAKIDVNKSYLLVGGGAINTATTFKRFGFSVACVSEIGDDDNAVAIEKELKKEGISLSFVTKNNSAPTAFSVLIVTGSQKRDRVILVERGAGDFLNFSNSLKSITSTKWYYTTALSGAHWKRELEEISQTAIKHAIKWAWNPGYAQVKDGVGSISKFMKSCDVFIVNKDEAVELLGLKSDPKNLCSHLLEYGPRSVIISDGSDGAHYADKDQYKYIKAHKTIKAKESTGAGDSFGSGFVAGLIKYNGDIDQALRIGIKNSESVIMKVGAREGILYL
jgi:ribokinase